MPMSRFDWVTPVVAVFIVGLLVVVVVGKAAQGMPDADAPRLERRVVSPFIERVEVPQDSTVCYRYPGYALSCVYNPTPFRR